MSKREKLEQLKKRRERTLNVRLPHVIKDKKEVEDLFIGNFHVKLPRQSSRSCRVVFSTVEDKIQNYKHAKNKTIADKRVVVRLLRDIVIKKTNKNLKKKVFIPEIKPEQDVTQSLFVANIAVGTKIDEIKSVLPGCVSVTLLKAYNKKFRSAIAKMENIHIATEYLKKKSKWPILKGHKLLLKADTRRKHKKKINNSTIKIYDNATEKYECKRDKNSDYKKSNDESS